MPDSYVDKSTVIRHIVKVLSPQLLAEVLVCEEGTLLSTKTIIETYKMLNEINESNDIYNVEWWFRKYLPIADCEGDHLSIDLESGEVVMHVHDSEIEKGIPP